MKNRNTNFAETMIFAIFGVIGIAMIVGGISFVLAALLGGTDIVPMLFTAGILFFMGIIFTAVGLLPLIRKRKAKKKKNRLMSTGKRIYAVVKEISYNVNYSVNGENPQIIYCFYEDVYTGESYEFKSENMWNNPGRVISTGEEIPVFVNPQDMSDYYICADDIMDGRKADY